MTTSLDDDDNLPTHLTKQEALELLARHGVVLTTPKSFRMWRSRNQVFPELTFKTEDVVAHLRKRGLW